jgi:hypothetical protein
MPAKPRTQRYYVSGVAQISIRAASAEEAVRKAREIAERRMTGACYIELDNISSDDRSSVALDDAASLDEEGA